MAGLDMVWGRSRGTAAAVSSGSNSVARGRRALGMAWRCSGMTVPDMAWGRSGRADLSTAWGCMRRLVGARFALHKAGQQLMQLSIGDAAGSRSITGGGNIGGGTAISSKGTTGSRGSIRWVASDFIRGLASGFMVSFSGLFARGFSGESGTRVFSHLRGLRIISTS